MNDFYTILGEPPSKSNSYRIGNKILFKTKQVTNYETAFLLQCRERNRNVQGLFYLELRVYYSTMRRDLDGCLKVILDCLQKAKVIANDNKCMRIVVEKLIDKERPRIEYRITEP